MKQNFAFRTRGMKYWTLIAGVLFLSTAATAYAEDTIGRTPWHLVDYWWDLGEARDFQTYSLDVTLSDDVDPEVRLYVAPIGLGTFSEQRFYGGIQTQSDGFTSFPHKKRSYIGKGAIFSRWDVRGLGAVKRSYGGLFESGGYEGDFVSVRNTLDWSAGKYTYSLRKMGSEKIDGKDYSWVGAFVYSHKTEQERYVGALRFEGAKLKLGRRIAAFVEIYGRAIPLEKIPKLTVTFDNWRVNGQPVTPVRATAHYPRNVPPYAATKVEGGKVQAIIGEPVDRKKQKGLTQNQRSYVQNLFEEKKKDEEKKMNPKNKENGEATKNEESE